MIDGNILNISENLQNANKELKEFISQYSYLEKSHKALTNSIKSTIRQVDSYYANSNELVHSLIKRSGNVKRAYEELNALMEEHKLKIKEADDSMSALSEQYGAPKERLAEVIKQITQMKNLEEEINELKAKGAENDAKKVLYLNEVENNLEKIRNSLKNDELSKSLLDDYENQNEELKEVLETQKEVKIVTEGIAKAQKDITNEIENGNERLLKWKKNGVIDFLKNFGTTVKTIAVSGFDKLTEVDQLTRDYGRHMGLSNRQMTEYRTNIIKNWGTMASKLGVEVKELIKFQEGYAEATNKSVQLSNEQVGSLYALSKNTGDGAIQTAQQNLDVFASSADATIEYLAKGSARAAKEGLNVKKYSDAFANNIKMASKYTFKNGIDGIQRMTLLSQRLKFDMQSIGGVIDKFSSIEGAIETSAKIQVLGGSFAQNFGNPIEAMSQALLDAEGFTQRIVDTVSNLSVFDRNTGEFSVSAADKMRIRAMADSMGMSYDELFNMSTQSLKSEEIKNITKGKDLSDEQISFLANKAQYNKEGKNWEIVDLNGVKHDISLMSKATIDQIRNNDSYEKLIQNDVHAIKEFLIKKGEDEKSIDETRKGWAERTKLGIAQPINWAADLWQGWLPPTIGIVSALGGLGTNIALLKSFKDAGRGLLRGGGQGSGSSASGSLPRGGGQGSGSSARGSSTTAQVNTLDDTAKTRQKRLAKAKKLRNLRKLKAVNKGLGTAAGVATVAFSAYEVGKEIIDYKQQKNEIIFNNEMGEREKAQALNDAKKNRNKGIGGATGGAAGAIIGASIGSVIPIVGTMIGGFIGGWVGNKLGTTIGEGVTETVDETMNELDKKKEGNDEKKSDIVTYVAQANGNLISIDNNVSKIVQMIGYKGYGAMGVINETTNSSNISQVKTDNKNITSSIKIDEVKVNVGGKIQLTSDKLSQNIDIDYLLSDYNFQKGIGKLIVNGIEDYNKTQIGGKTLERV